MPVEETAHCRLMQIAILRDEDVCPGRDRCLDEHIIIDVRTDVQCAGNFDKFPDAVKNGFDKLDSVCGVDAIVLRHVATRGKDAFKFVERRPRIDGNELIVGQRVENGRIRLRRVKDCEPQVDVNPYLRIENDQQPLGRHVWITTGAD